MKNIINFFKTIYSIIKTWVVKNGVEGLGGLAVGIYLLMKGHSMGAGFAFGVFAAINWDILKKWIISIFTKD